MVETSGVFGSGASAPCCFIHWTMNVTKISATGKAWGLHA